MTDFNLTTFAGSSPPWSLPALDANFAALSTAIKRRAISVTDPEYGAVGDGVTDDTVALQAALTAWRTSSAEVLLFPPGIYKITAALAVAFVATETSGKTIFAYGATIQPTLSSGWALTISSAVASTVRNIFIHGLRFSPLGGSESGMLRLSVATTAEFLYGCNFYDVIVDNTVGDGIWVDGNVFETNFFGCQVRAAANITGIGIKVAPSGVGTNPSSLNFWGCTTFGFLRGIHGPSPIGDLHIFGGTVLNAYNDGVLIENMLGGVIAGLHVENNWQAGGGTGGGIRIIGKAVLSGVYGTTNSALTQKYVVTGYASDHLTILEGTATGSTVKYANLDGAAGSAVYISGNLTYDATANVAVSRQSITFQPPSFTVAGVPAAATYARGLIYVSNETGGATIAFSDGTNWRRVQDRAIIS